MNFKLFCKALELTIYTNPAEFTATSQLISLPKNHRIIGARDDFLPVASEPD